ncbi:NADPH dehydrogenase [Penicillium maclennaniae]|uniref:NADPH dehydrogenase n=1 Tax=Penicillium maclennaniae TaxID=1343394 RepID=UPI00253FB66E|nr:NADPH dehydrogenase [Penicillium maclennaniae]KAJ5668454.1 NADPH dehydrogenase [Penicillium maclennaniae]
MGSRTRCRTGRSPKTRLFCGFEWEHSHDGIEPCSDAHWRGLPAWIDDYARAAKNAIAAGFDGVEIHGANGYLRDQFLQDTANNRDDQWGGSVDKRSRFGLEVANAVTDAVGPERTGYRISPWSAIQAMHMKGLNQQFTHFVQGLSKLNLTYLHVVEPRISGSLTIEAEDEDDSFVFDASGNSGTIILARGFTAHSAEKKIKSRPTHHVVTIAFGRQFLANPDLPFRLSKGLPLNQYDRETFYTPKSPVGYVDYQFSSEFATESY